MSGGHTASGLNHVRVLFVKWWLNNCLIWNVNNCKCSTMYFPPGELSMRIHCIYRWNLIESEKITKYLLNSSVRGLSEFCSLSSRQLMNDTSSLEINIQLVPHEIQCHLNFVIVIYIFKFFLNYLSWVSLVHVIPNMQCFHQLFTVWGILQNPWLCNTTD